MVELARLERVYGRKVIQGSNPCLSAKLDYRSNARYNSGRFVCPQPGYLRNNVLSEVSTAFV